MFPRILAALMAITLITSFSAPALAASFRAKINSSSAKVYNVPSTSSKIYVQGGQGVTVTVTGYANGWARIKYNGNTGYTQIKNLNLVSRPKGYTKKSTPVYRQDSTSSTRLGTLSAGSAVYVVGVSSNFYRVQNASGTITGYVQKGTLATKSALMSAYKKYLTYMSASSGSGSSGSSSSSNSGSNSSASNGSSSGGSTSGGSTSGGSSSSGGSTTTLTPADALIKEALKYLGAGYALPANPPSTFNCSAYVKYVYGKLGYSMKSTAVEQCADNRYTRITDISKLKKGDILCFDTTEDDDDNGRVCDHTAIYYGNNIFIESSQKVGKVQTNTLTEWYKSRFICARRVF